MIATVTQSSTELNEGGTVSFFVSTSGVANYTDLYYTTEDEIDGTIKESDFISNSLSGPFQIFNDEGSIDVTVSRDRVTEGTERFLIKIRETSITGTVVGISTLIRINDTSRAPSINASGKTFGPIQINEDNGVIKWKQNVAGFVKVKRTYRGVLVNTHAILQRKFGLPEQLIIPVKQLARTTAFLDELILRCTVKRLVTLPSYLQLNGDSE